MTWTGFDLPPGSPPGLDPAGEPGQGTPSPLTAGVITRLSMTPTTIHLQATDASGGSPPYTYQWQRDGVDVGDDDLDLSEIGLTPGSDPLWSLIYTDQDGNTDTATYTTTLPTGLATVVHPVYLITLIAPKIPPVVGATTPIKFGVQRSDGADIDPPLWGEIDVTLPDGSQAEPETPEKESNTAGAQVVVAANFAWTLEGRHTAKLLLDVASAGDTQRIGIDVLITVDP